MSLSIVLVGTTLPENVGSAARAMANFGISDLRLVAPQCDARGDRAVATATHGARVLDGARVFDSLHDALADRTQVWATSAMHREFRKPTETPRQAAPRWDAGSAVVFGPERSGLTYAELTWAHALLTIPTTAEARALNLAAAVAIVGWEWSARGEIPEESGGSVEAAPMGQQVHALVDLEARLDRAGWASEPGLRTRTLRSLRTAFLRARFTSSELTLVRSVFAALGKGEGHERR